jgi:predicted dehydrogenase
MATGSASWRYRLQNRARIGYAQAWLDLDPATPAIGERLRIGLDGPSRVEELMLPLRDQLPLMYDDFAEACLGRKQAAVPASEGLDDLRMMEAIMQAAAKRSPVQV